MKDKVYLKHWLALKAQNYSGSTDLYYLKVANNIKSNFDENNTTFLLTQFFSKDDLSTFCCFLTCYFEDIISETNIFCSFKVLYKELYKKTLPFFETGEDYIEDEINLEDISFLSWYYINTIQNEQFISPYNEFIYIISKSTMQVLEEEYEYAPENKTLFKSFQFKNNNNDFYTARAHIQHVFFDSYLFYPDIKYRLNLEHLKVVEENEGENPEITISYIREVTDQFSFNTKSVLLALPAKDWAKTILGKSHSNYYDIDSINKKVSGLFLYKSQDTNSVFLEHIASGIGFEMTKKSFDYYEDLEKDDIVFIGLVMYRNEWWFSGNFSIQNFDANLILDLKNSAEDRSGLNFLLDQDKIKDILYGQQQAFLRFNNNSPIKFLKSEDIKNFTSTFMSFYNGSLGSEGDLEKAKKRAKEDGYFGKENYDEGYDDEVIIFFNPNNGIEIYNDVINAFPDKNNPFFTKESTDDIMHLLIDQQYSTEFVNYFIKTYKNKLKTFKKEPYKSYLKDLDFLLRYWKNDDYKTKSTLVITGNKN